MKNFYISIFVIIITNLNSIKAQVDTNQQFLQDSINEIAFTPENQKVLNIVNEEQNRFNIGLKLGVATGSGILFGVDRIAKKWSADLTILPISIDDFNLTIIGGSVKYSLQDLGKYNLYLNTGISYNYYAKDVSTNLRVDPFRFGIGVGFMQFVSQNFAYDIQILGTYFTKSNEFYPIPQITLMYHFK